MNEPKRIGIDLDVFDHAPMLEDTRCGGALLYLSREEAEALQNQGMMTFATEIPATIPGEGRASIRIHCRGEILSKAVSETLPPDPRDPPDAEPRKHARRVKYGLCARCSGFELAVRTRLDREQNPPQPKGGDRRGSGT